MHNIALCFKRGNKKMETFKSVKTDNTASKYVSIEQNKIDCTVSNHVNNGGNKILLQTASVKLVGKLSSKVPTRIKCAKVQVKIRDILDKDEVIIEALEIDEVTSVPLEFAPIDTINELKTKEINLCDVDHSPATLIPKLLIQRSWNLKIEWDVVLPDDYQREFSSWLRDVDCSLNVKIAKSLNIDKIHGLSLHVFCDASEIAYSAVIFLHKMEKDTISVSFVCAKRRVAPLRKTTIPILELLVCCIGACLLTVAIKALRLENIPVFYWSDSSTALYWIERNENWGVFVKNRVQEIKSLTSNGTWKHVPGNLNAADLPSRKCAISALVKSRRWEGPD
ncbi:integrase catalytic domain-containing protein [Nephila pilipes]|uniref:Integrase catalytic domain-containing protein n=1 Tax=Nephila pilipes TaxID=299642 RepID=A0A8X6IKJ9_NEPPI|nr:integrase catalytic domain-containing protein [Nephila pilipes]